MSKFYYDLSVQCKQGQAKIANAKQLKQLNDSIEFWRKQATVATEREKELQNRATDREKELQNRATEREKELQNRIIQLEKELEESRRERSDSDKSSANVSVVSVNSKDSNESDTMKCESKTDELDQRR